MYILGILGQPQANSNIERWHRWLGATLTMYCNTNKNDWDEHLDSALYAYRTSVCTSTNRTPFEIMFHRRGQGLADFIYLTAPEDEEREHKHNLYTSENISHIFKEVMRTQLKMTERNRKIRDKTRIDTKFEPGDSILIWDINKDKYGPYKHKYRFTGPHILVRKSRTNPLNYIVVENGKQQTQKKILCKSTRSI
jgi:hypothetical protein